jgi:prepilin-type N-terminal cleavage/methylation domain-containing protein
MRTFPPTTSERGGFTFVEIMVALAILTMLTVIALPAYRAMFQSEREREFNRLVATLRSLCTEAVLARKPHRLEIDLAEQRYLPLRKEEQGRFAPIANAKDLVEHRLPESIRMVELIPYGAKGSPVTSRVVTIGIDASGFIDPFLLHLREGAQDFTLRVGFICRPELLPGYGDASLQ